MSILADVLRTNEVRFKEAVEGLQDKDLCTFYLAMLKENGETVTTLTVNELLDSLPDSIVDLIIAHRNNDSIRVPKPTERVLPVQDSKLQRVQAGRNKLVKGSSYKGRTK